MSNLASPLGFIGAGAYSLLLARPREVRLSVSWLLGFVLFLSFLHWMPDAAVIYYRYYDLSFAAGSLAYVIVCGLAALQFVFVHWCARHLPDRFDCALALRIPIAWLVGEVLFYNPFPWFIGSLQLRFLPFSQTADLLGQPLVSFLVFWIMGLIVIAFSSPLARAKRVRLLAVALLILLITSAYSSIRIWQIHARSAVSESVAVAAIQGNDPVLFEPTDEQIDEKLRTYLNLSTTLSPMPDLIVWPEGAWLRPITNGTQKLPTNFGLSDRHLRRPLIFAGRLGFPNMNGSSWNYQTSSNILQPDGDFAAGYKKRYTLPLAEDIPFREYFPWLTKIFGERYFLPGKEDLPLTVDLSKGPGGVRLRPPLTIATLICYEDLIPDLFQQITRKYGADFLLALTNEQWFGTSVASEQHALLAAWRAVENRRYLLRVTTTGQTILVDPTGSIVDRIPAFQPGVLSVPKLPLTQMLSLFTLLGLWPLRILSCLILLIILRHLGTMPRRLR
ncbi:MAG: apolipoprotein N-acyltransferase [Deltaproteobacteria bacterium]|nr:apolipoprotein N-acyltransferase [Deltaproteobacteria bacterium]